MDELGERAEELDLDPQAVAAQLGQYRQGDVLDVAKATWLYSPDSPNHPRELEEAEVEAEEPVMSSEAGIETGLSVIVSQTCDVHRLPDTEPYVVLAPLIELEEGDYTHARRGHSVRFFAFPQIQDHEDKENLALDGRMLVSIEKMALLSEHIEHLPCPLTEPDQDRLSAFLGRRLGRKAFSDELNEHLVRPVEEGIKSIAKSQGYKDFFEAVKWIGLGWTPGTGQASVLVLTVQNKRQLAKINDDNMRGAAKKLQGAIAHRLRGSAYDVQVYVQDAEATPAVDILSRHRIVPDLHGAPL